VRLCGRDGRRTAQRCSGHGCRTGDCGAHEHRFTPLKRSLVPSPEKSRENAGRQTGETSRRNSLISLGPALLANSLGRGQEAYDAQARGLNQEFRLRPTLPTIPEILLGKLKHRHGKSFPYDPLAPFWRLRTYTRREHGSPKRRPNPVRVQSPGASVRIRLRSD
jgi:hypothetical protein